MDKLTALLNAPVAVRRATALAVAAVLLAIAVGAVWFALSSLTAEARIVTAKREELGLLNSVIALRSALESEQGSASANGENGEFLRGSSVAVIRGNLQSRFSAIAASRGIEVISVGNAPALQRGNIQYAGLRANFSGTNEAVLSTLFDIETSRPYLVIRSAQIRSAVSFQANGVASEPTIVAQVVFYGALPPDADVEAALAEPVR